MVLDNVTQDVTWFNILYIVDHIGALQFNIPARIMLAFLTISQSNANCQRLVCPGIKNKTEFRENLSTTITKLSLSDFCVDICESAGLVENVLHWSCWRVEIMKD